MNWKDKISGCFGEIDLIFGVHPLDSERAREMFKEALAEDAELDDIVNECRDYLKSKSASQEHIDEQEKGIREFYYKNFK